MVVWEDSASCCLIGQQITFTQLTPATCLSPRDCGGGEGAKSDKEKKKFRGKGVKEQRREKLEGG